LGNIAIRAEGAAACSNALRGFWEEGNKQHEGILSHVVELKQNVQDTYSSPINRTWVPVLVIG
jgi:hypothetical protein